MACTTIGVDNIQFPTDRLDMIVLDISSSYFVLLFASVACMQAPNIEFVFEIDSKKNFN